MATGRVLAGERFAEGAVMQMLFLVMQLSIKIADGESSTTVFRAG